MNADLKINNCMLVFQCPQKWTELDPTVNSSVRSCQECQKFVFLVGHEWELEFHAHRRHCIAYIEQSRILDESIQFLGELLPPKYDGPTMSIWLTPTLYLERSQVKFISIFFDFNTPIYQINSMLCNGEKHQLIHHVNPDLAESISRQLEDRAIEHQISIDPQISGD